MFGPSRIGKNTLVAMTISSMLAVFPQGAAGDLLADAERVHVGGVEEVDAGLERAAKERLRRGLVEDPRPPLGRAVAHAAEAQRARR